MTGSITLNGETLTSKLFQKHCYIVYQTDFLAPKLTCRETLEYAALNCINDPDRIGRHVNELIENLGLSSCENTVVGDEFTQGLSGGQKRRLSVCVGLVKMPKFLFLDEPTSGLDAVSAFKTCSHLKNITKKYNICAALTIHQPNTKIYDLFTKLLLLKSGKVAYFGPSNKAEKWFAKEGFPLPARTNIADFLLEVVESENFVNKFEVGRSEMISRQLTLVSEDMEVQDKLGSRSKPSVWKETWWTTHREALLIFRDPMLYSGRCGAFILVSIFFAMVYINSRERKQEQVVTRIWLLLWLIGVPTSMASVVILSHNRDTIMMTRNVRNGIMRPFSFLVARNLQLPMMFIFSACSISLGGYGMCNWYTPAYLNVLLIHALTMLTFELTAELTAIICSHFSVAILANIGVWFANFLFDGLLVQDSSVVWPLRAICYILPLRYGIQAMVYSEFVEAEFSGAEACDENSDLQCHGRGFFCIDNFPCYGKTGDQVLDTLHYNFPLLSSTDRVFSCMMYMLAYCLVVKTVYILRIFWMVKYG